MNLLAALLLTTALTRVEAVHLTTVRSQLAVRVALSGEPGLVAVHREGAGARVSIMDVQLGGSFAGGRRFAWTPADGFDPGLLSSPTRVDRIEVAAAPSEVSVLLQVPPEVAIDVRRDRNGLLLVLREMPVATDPPQVARAAPRAPPPPPPVERAVAEPAPPPEEPATPEPVASEPPAATPPATALAPAQPPPAPVTAPVPPVEEAPQLADAAPAVPEEPPVPETTAPAVASAETAAAPAAQPDTIELARGLFPAAAAASVAHGAGGQESVDELYGQLFPGGPPQTVAETVEPAVEPMGDAQGVPFGPFRVRAGLDARYVDADTYIEGPDSRARDRYLEISPRIAAEAPLGDGRFTIEYMPSLRAFATYDDVNATSHRVSGGIDVPLGPSVIFSLKDSFVSGVLDTRDADPGGEYFFGLGRFHRNTIDAGASIVVGPRTSLELGVAASSLVFQEDSSFFDYDSRLASAGFGYELTPTLKAMLSYAYDTVPSPDERPEAEARAHNVRVMFTGDILPLLTGQVSFGYRDQETPNAGDGGTSYRGFVMGGSVTKQFSRESDVTLFLNRSTPVSAFEDNAFYIYTGIQGSGRFPLPLEFQLQGGLGYQWNDYRTVAADIGEPRQDRILGYYVGLRRAIVRQLFLSAAYRREERTSNLEHFNTDADGFIFQLEWDIFGNTP